MAKKDRCIVHSADRDAVALSCILIGLRVRFSLLLCITWDYLLISSHYEIQFCAPEFSTVLSKARVPL
jgi:hypothetical protein